MQAKPTWEKVPNVAGFYRTQRAGGYAYRFRLPGERTWTSNNEGLGLEEAKRWRNRLMGAEKHERPIKSTITFIEWAERWLDESMHIQPATRRNYEAQLRRYLTPLHKMRLHEIDAAALRRVMAAMQEKGLATNTMRAALVPVSAMLATAKERKLIAANPVIDLEKRDRPRVVRGRKKILTPAEAAKLIEHSGNLAPVVGVLLFAGLRISETLGLQWADVDFRDNEIHVWKQLARERGDATIDEYFIGLKGEGEGDMKERRVEMSRVLRALLIAHRGDRIVHPKDFVFTSLAGSHYSTNSVQRRFKKAVKKAGLDGTPQLTPHQCRHNFASALIASGADVGFVADQLGHSNPTVTLTIYRHEFRAAREKGSGAAAIDAIYGAAMG